MMDRRTFVHQCLGAAAGAGGSLVLTSCASLVVRPVTPVDGRIQLALNRYPELTEAAGSLRLQADGMREPIYVLAQTDGRYIALSPICTHLGCTVEVERDRLVCPCHGSTYDRGGAVLKGPAERALTRFPTQVTDGVLVIELRTPE
jgi:cytochrome b6-f complex iron-sulfur subunit